MNRRSVGMLVLARITIRERLASRILHDISAGDAFGGPGRRKRRYWRGKLQALVHKPQPLYERAYHEKRKIWHLIHEQYEIFSLMAATSQFVLARHVATLGDPSIKAISPKKPPDATVSITFPFSSISTSPERTTSIIRPGHLLGKLARRTQS
jgi:hypothetical protein